MDFHKIWIEEEVLTAKVDLEQIFLLAGITGILHVYEKWLVDNTYLVKMTEKEE